jgi:DNA-binding transcriptional MerR regulator
MAQNIKDYSPDYSIGTLSRETGCKVPTIRYYEKVGLMPAPARTQGNQRRYSEKHRQRLVFIRHSRDLGFSPDAIRELLTLSDDPNQSCEEADAIAQRQLEAVETRLSQLEALKSELEHMVHQCKGGTIASCQIIERLSDHELCITPDHVH